MDARLLHSIADRRLDRERVKDCPAPESLRYNWTVLVLPMLEGRCNAQLAILTGPGCASRILLRPHMRLLRPPGRRESLAELHWDPWTRHAIRLDPTTLATHHPSKRSARLTETMRRPRARSHLMQVMHMQAPCNICICHARSEQLSGYLFH
jgi:hypothetical protein